MKMIDYLSQREDQLKVELKNSGTSFFLKKMIKGRLEEVKKIKERLIHCYYLYIVDFSGSSNQSDIIFQITVDLRMSDYLLTESEIINKVEKLYPFLSDIKIINVRIDRLLN